VRKKMAAIKFEINPSKKVRFEEGLGWVTKTLCTQKEANAFSLWNTNLGHQGILESFFNAKQTPIPSPPKDTLMDSACDWEWQMDRFLSEWKHFFSFRIYWVHMMGDYYAI
jgi:hypothetical protein